MSQRLYVGDCSDEEAAWYDCVVQSADVTAEWLRQHWLSYRDGHYLGPFKIVIGDLNLFHQITSTLETTLSELGHAYPDDVWAFYYAERSLEHPTKKELCAWLAEEAK